MTLTSIGNNKFIYSQGLGGPTKASRQLRKRKVYRSLEPRIQTLEILQKLYEATANLASTNKLQSASIRRLLDR